jgi:hypothetical protein
MNVKELIEKLSQLPPESEVTITLREGRIDTANLTIQEGYFVTGAFDHGRNGEGHFIDQRMAVRICDDGKPLLDLTSEHIKPSILIHYKRKES